MLNYKPGYPTSEHQRAAELVVKIFASEPAVAAILLIGSCARGKATRDSCLDLVLLLAPDITPARQQQLRENWQRQHQTLDIFRTLRRVGQYSHIDLELHDGCFIPGEHHWTSGPDQFELALGNLLVYAIPLWENGDYWRRLRTQWLPYYDPTLRLERLARVKKFCLNNLNHISGYVHRGLYFQAFHRLWHAFGEFLQALFITRQCYPIAYDKWIQEQIVEILELPQLYPQLPKLFELEHFESTDLIQKGEQLRSLVWEFIGSQSD
ncbi:nucleotidyltransferase domain-containing protein [candidate division KSB1 bacterium]|nr:nucleotidyltransferase domain-containing protein [candidate division KSB1 bacterium]